MDNVIDIILKKPIKNLDEFYKIFRKTNELLSDMPYKDTYLYDIENNLTMIKITLIEKHIDNIKILNNLKNQFITLFKHSKNDYALVKKLIAPL